MAKKQFKAESKRLLDIMVNSIYTHKEIFLRELISNASDALDKRHYQLLTDKKKKLDSKELYIKIISDKDKRTLTISDTGIGMNKQELEDNLGTIAKSGSLAFKLENDIKDKNDIIGQFGVGFYSAFMVADKVTVISKKEGESDSYKWESTGMDGYTIAEDNKETVGTDIILNIKDNTKDAEYDDFLDESTIHSLVKRYSNFIKYPILMNVTKTRAKKDNDKETETYSEEETLNSMIPIWRKDKKELKAEDYNNFYHEQHFGFDEPLKVIHTRVEGAISYDALLYIPSELPFDFYTKQFEKGLELYSNNVLVIEQCSDLLPDYFSFVKGIVDSPDVSLNISRELLQHDKQLQFMAKKIKDKIKSELLDMQKGERDKYETFFKAFGRIIKYGVYSNWGTDKDFLQDLLMFYSSTAKKLITFDEYIAKMSEDQKYIYYATGESIEKIDRLPQTEFAKEKGFDILYLTDEVDEFAIKMIFKYKDKELKSVSSVEHNETSDEEHSDEADKDVLTFMKETLGDKITEVKASSRLKKYPACLTSKGDLSIEMEKVLHNMPNGNEVKAEKVLEVNTDHEIFKVLKDAFTTDKDKAKAITRVLYNQAMLVEGLSIDDPVAYADDIYQLIK